MSNTIGNVKDLDASRTEALQGLLRSLGHTSDNPSSDPTLPTEQIQKLSQTIKEILGDGEDPGLISGDPSNQLLNDDGLPIVDISEPVHEGVQTSASSLLVPEQDLIPLSLVPPEVRERRRRERDRILDLLEEEERVQQLQEGRDAEEERKEAIRKRKATAKAELEQLKAARELQKRMGQALVQHAKGAGENYEGQKDDARSNPKTTTSATKKVSFADAPEVEPDERDQEMSINRSDWGDITPARLRAQTRVPLVSKAEAQKYPMKLRVVERHPTAFLMSSFQDDADSDDESASSTGHRSPCLENESPGEEDGPSSSNNNGSSDDEVLEEGFDYDTAQHHREIALEYYKKRHAIGAETAKVMHAHSLDDGDQQESSNGQLPLSRFRADRMATAYDQSHSSVSTSIGQTVIPASRQKSLRNSVRLGKLEDDQLAGGGSGESGSEDETVKEVIQMLRTGNLQNVGPDFNTPSIITPPRNSDVAESPSVGTATTVREAKPSRFKVARGGGIQETSTSQGNSGRHSAQPRPAISGVVERKPARSLPNQRFPVNKPSPRSSVKFSEQGPLVIIDSPSFPMMSASSTSPAHPVITASPHQAQLERPLSVVSDPSTTHDSIIRSQDPLSVERPVSKFMAERRK